MKELRCSKCDKLLGKSLRDAGGIVEIKCHKCKTVTQFISTPVSTKSASN